MFQRLCRINPSPYGALMNLGDGNSSSRLRRDVRALRRAAGGKPARSPAQSRGSDAIGDAEQIRQLLNSEKDEFELNMCTDVDRNDKARVCVPGTIKYWRGARSRLLAVPYRRPRRRHAEPGFDSLDAFLTHAWAVTVTGAPKLWAMQFVEDRRTFVAALVCRRDRSCEFRRQHQYRPDHRGPSG